MAYKRYGAIADKKGKLAHPFWWQLKEGVISIQKQAAPLAANP